MGEETRKKVKEIIKYNMTINEDKKWSLYIMGNFSGQFRYVKSREKTYCLIDSITSENPTMEYNLLILLSVKFARDLYPITRYLDYPASTWHIRLTFVEDSNLGEIKALDLFDYFHKKMMDIKI